VLGYLRYCCTTCRRKFNERTGTAFNFLEYPTDIQANGIDTNYQYNSLNRLINMNIKQGVLQINGYSYTLGAAGNRLSVADHSGRIAQYSYDSLYRLTSESVSGASNPTNNGVVNYSYDKVGNRLQRSSTVTAVPVDQHSYDNNDRLTTDTYDANGNTTLSGNRTYIYDEENHLIRVRDNPTNTEIMVFTYDGENNRFSKIVTQNGVTTATRYLTDNNNHTGYSQVVEESTTVNGTLSSVTQYSYGHDLISQRRWSNGQ
jgi:YD repeat-containing protein